MKKIITLFKRNYETDRLVRDEVTPGAEWVLAGEGIATRKLDGTCCLMRDGKLYKRYEVKIGGKPPSGFEPANEIDEVTGKQQGWVPVGDGPEDRWHREALKELTDHSNPPKDGTYELCGPKIQGNPEGFGQHILWNHDSADRLLDAPRAFDELREYLRERDIEGIVWHHEDGRMVKVKKRDFGFKRINHATSPERKS